jgi:hypothetical protein
LRGSRRQIQKAFKRNVGDRRQDEGKGMKGIRKGLKWMRD